MRNVTQTSQLLTSLPVHYITSQFNINSDSSDLNTKGKLNNIIRFLKELQVHTKRSPIPLRGNNFPKDINH